jgi:hypothetical protein
LSEEEESSSEKSSDEDTSSKGGDSSDKESSDSCDDNYTTLLTRIENLEIKPTLTPGDKEGTTSAMSQGKATVSCRPPPLPETSPSLLSAPEYGLNPHVQPTLIRLRNPPNFDRSPGRAKTFLHQLNTFISQQALFPGDGHKVTYAISLLKDRAAKWATGFAASPQDYLFDSWD